MKTYKLVMPEYVDELVDFSCSCGSTTFQVLYSPEMPECRYACTKCGKRYNVQAAEHDWHKTNMVTISKGGRMYDTYRCEFCGITGKRYGLSPYISRDAKFKTRVYCDAKV